MDASETILTKWKQSVSNQFSSVDIVRSEQTVPEFEWQPAHMAHIVALRQRCLDYARARPFEYLLMLDADVILTNADVLKNLLDSNKTLVAPLVVNRGTIYSNFWGAVDERTGYYKRSDDYLDVVHRRSTGCCLPVPLVHSVFLLNLNAPGARSLNYDPPPVAYQGPVDDMIIFSKSAAAAGVQPYLNNEYFYGILMAPFKSVVDEANELRETQLYFINVLQESLPLSASARQARLDANSLRAPAYDGEWIVEKSFMINLDRRTERLWKMNETLTVLNIEYERITAVDGELLNATYLEANGIAQLPGYLDPYLNRPLKWGEIGCFLSHYSVWRRIADANWSSALVLEDDVMFFRGFRQRASDTIRLAERLVPDWDLIYFGRKAMGSHGSETVVDGSGGRLVWPRYSYWTLGYVLSGRGARKLLAQRPLERLMAVDEFLPVMYDQHPNELWTSHFAPRNLRALSAQPLLIEPAAYIGEPAYYTDTEQSGIWWPDSHDTGAPAAGADETQSSKAPQRVVSEQPALSSGDLQRHTDGEL